MKRKRIILAALAAVLVAVAGIAVWHWVYRSGLSAPIELVDIPPGEFLMGGPEDEEGRGTDETQRLVKITYAIKIGKYKVTQQQWREVMGTTFRQQYGKVYGGLTETTFPGRIKAFWKTIKDNPLGTVEEIRCVGIRKTCKSLLIGRAMPLYDEQDGSPMGWVSWNEAMDFCSRLTERARATAQLPVGHAYRLPTESEWRYSCRADPQDLFADEETAGVMPNALGLHDLHSREWEWLNDYYVDRSAGNAINPSISAGGAGSLNSHGVSPRFAFRICRASGRVMSDSNLRSRDISFRVVLAPVRPRE